MDLDRGNDDGPVRGAIPLVPPDVEASGKPVEGAVEAASGIVVRPAWLLETRYWALSALLHLVVVLLLVGLVTRERRDEPAPATISIRAAAPPEPYSPEKKRDVLRKVEIPQPTTPQIPVLRRQIDEITIEVPRGIDAFRQSDIDLDARFLEDAIGLTGGAAGAYGARWGKGSLAQEGGGEETESAVRAALEWLVRHQAPDGSWSASGFSARCAKKPCTNVNVGRFGIGNASDGDYDAGVTALAVLAFTGSGNSHRSASDPRFATALGRALDWLLARQQRDATSTHHGRIGGGDHRKVMYEHAIATMAIGELLLLSGDRLRLVAPVRQAVEYALAARNPGAAWRYGHRDGENDTSVTGWMVLALKTGKLARLGIPERRFDEAFADSIAYFRSLTDASGRTGYQERGRERGRVPTMTSVSVLCRIFAGEDRSARDIRGGVDQLLADRPAWSPNGDGVDFYYWYYATYATFQVGDAAWGAWNPAMKAALVESQRRGACEDGSWDPIDASGRRAGRVYSTALGAMTLEVYYRFERTRVGVGFLSEQ